MFVCMCVCVYKKIIQKCIFTVYKYIHVFLYVCVCLIKEGSVHYSKWTAIYSFIPVNPKFNVSYLFVFNSSWLCSLIDYSFLFD